MIIFQNETLKSTRNFHPFKKSYLFLNDEQKKL